MVFMLGNNLVFIDTFQFMSSSFEKMVNNIPKETLKSTTQQFGQKTKHITQKGVYPYDYMDLFDKFKHYNNLAPSK